MKLWKPALALAAMTVSCTAGGKLRVENRYLHLPVARDGDPVAVRLLDGDKVVRYFDVALAGNKQDALYWSSIDIAEFRGKTLTVSAAEPDAAERLVAVAEQSGKIRRPANAYHEKYRPQFHFSPMVGWTNDPNGLTYLDGEYHLFFQHNPFGVRWGNMTWGHAVSKDLLHWRELGDALLPDRLGTIYSGSGVVDHKNTAGVRGGPTQPMVVFYTSAGEHSYAPRPFGQSMAYSIDRGRSWTRYPGNPVVPNKAPKNRDPKVFWHQPSRQWVMVLYLKRGTFLLQGSRNLKQWTRLSEVDFPDGFECPELFELRVDGDRKNTRWVMWEAAGRHLIGRFDGTRFTPETGVLRAEWGRNTYASQTWNDTPDGRRILIAWMRAKNGDQRIYPGMPFNQQMSIPRELSLHTMPEGIRLFAQPVREIAKLYSETREWSNLTLGKGADPLAKTAGELFDLQLTIEARRAKSVTLRVRDIPIVYDAAARTLSCLGKSVAIEPKHGRLDLRVLVDRTSLEIFAAAGRYVMSYCIHPDTSQSPLSLRSEGGAAEVSKLVVRKLSSIWAEE